MSLVKKSFNKMNCSFSGHEISDEDEDKLYVTPTNMEGIRQIKSQCSRCNIPVSVMVDPIDEDQYIITEI